MSMIFRALRKNYELVPLVTIVSCSVTMSTSAMFYFAYQKTDVVIRKTKNPFPYYKIDPNKPQKLLTLGQKYVPDEQLEKLRKEIGSPPHPRH
ncbi:normal mucosa of esophagus-specific gene 1 protein-like [Ptychodera flava]|uniref:normal mucosa of esophagus-specific gene 1 protein-like n=1 Tax=Ptychodera flava TaxID=63121 RepID=UPI003969D785